MTLHLRLDRWYLGLHGLALLRSYPFGDLDGVEARKEAMRSLLAGEEPEWLFETTEVEELPAGLAYEAWAATYDDPNPLIATEERELLAVLDQVPPRRRPRRGDRDGPHRPASDRSRSSRGRVRPGHWHGVDHRSRAARRVDRGRRTLFGSR